MTLFDFLAEIHLLPDTRVFCYVHSMMLSQRKELAIVPTPWGEIYFKVDDSLDFGELRIDGVVYKIDILIPEDAPFNLLPRGR